jgi:hypothetical protein
MNGDKFERKRKRSVAEIIELDRVVRPPEAEKLSGLSWDTLKRKRGEYIIVLGEKARGMRVKHALGLAEEEI